MVQLVYSLSKQTLALRPSARFQRCRGGQTGRALCLKCSRHAIRYLERRLNIHGAQMHASVLI